MNRFYIPCVSAEPKKRKHKAAKRLKCSASSSSGGGATCAALKGGDCDCRDCQCLSKYLALVVGMSIKNLLV